VSQTTETSSPYLAANHMGFAVSDLDRSIAFYTGVLGEPPFFRQIYEAEYLGTLVGYPGCRMDAAFFRLPGTETFLELLQYLDPLPSTVDMETYNVGNGHLCLQVKDLAADFQRVAALGARFRSQGPVDIEFGPFKGGKVSYCRDPDGISLEFIQLPDGAP
jgi:catechol 2,3-dioxygenase-like lactoylglutathione lyase family enzyme